MKVVIVESPNKCQTIQKYLGSDYKVVATKGHIRDLATSGKGGLGVDCEHDFAPTYIILRDKKRIVNDLKADAKKADEVILATDPDREGEAIAWHLAEVLKLPANNKRLEFHEITKEAIQHAIENPRQIDLKLVASQEARRILDRIVGFKLSDVLQRKNNLRSGGRVQSATLKLIVDHEREIRKFVPEEYWTLVAKLNDGEHTIEAPIYKYKDKEITKLASQHDVDEVSAATGQELKILRIEKSVRTINPKLPFKTSTLQQEAISRFGLSASKVSHILQDLYEGINVNGEHTGLITYIRTVSTHLSDTYVTRAKEYIQKRFGADYLGHMEQLKDEGEDTANSGHEAIRPTSNHRTPASLRVVLKQNKKFTNAHFKIYELIYNRTLSFLMSSKKEETTNVIIGNDQVSYKVSGNKTIYPGYEVLTGPGEHKDLGFVPVEGASLKVVDLVSEKKSTTPPPHYSEAKIIKLMEDKGIGRPSTYSSTISTLQNRTYVVKEKGAIVPTKNGEKAVEFLEKKFTKFVDAHFTSEMEDKLDKIQAGASGRTETLKDYYKDFMEKVDEAMKEALGNCPKCGAPLVRVKGKYGSFTGCSRYPDCDYKKKEPKASEELLDKKCPKCGAQLIKRTNKKGKVFIACTNFPKCRYIEGKQEQPKKLEIIKKCPACKDGNLVVRKGWNKVKKQPGFFLGCTNFPKCRHIEEYDPSKKE
ncbi:MAG: type I DNA topoisomerase [Bacilli bacterium]|nr:type I DNA topoisomerase [Bacilli bacterium]